MSIFLLQAFPVVMLEGGKGVVVAKGCLVVGCGVLPAPCPAPTDRGIAFIWWLRLARSKKLLLQGLPAAFVPRWDRGLHPSQAVFTLCRCHQVGALRLPSACP